jgi:hypothetical protein
VFFHRFICFFCGEVLVFIGRTIERVPKHTQNIKQKIDVGGREHNNKNGNRKSKENVLRKRNERAMELMTLFY